ncbi:MAG: ribosome-binding factor A [Planctomycetes bacterium]|nr:ribosome-binding factor A [Planctomycetota bacterium]
MAKDYTEERLIQAIQAAFENLADDDDLAGVSISDFEMSSDRRRIALYWSGPPDADEDIVESALEELRSELEDEAEEVLKKRPRIRFEVDQGAVHQRRVNTILEELADDDDDELDDDDDD